MEAKQIELAWKSHRPYLLDLAFRMLGDIGAAEDVVQEAFTRLLRAQRDGIEDLRGWMIVVTSRLCLDQIRARKSRPAPGTESVTDTLDKRASEVAASASNVASVDPADRVTLDDSVRLALLVVLERLSPAERVVFVLHDVFQLPFETIAGTVGRSAASCRQLAHRARQKIESTEGQARFDVTDSRHRIVTERFIAACSNGDLEALLEVLDPEVAGTVDIRESLVVEGSGNVARNILRYWGGRATLVTLAAGEHPALLGFLDRKLMGLIVLDVRDDRVRKIHVIADPAKLAFFRSQLQAV